jgi:hypothetical protein
VFKRLSAALLAGPLLLGLIPTAASAAPAESAVRSFDHRATGHYRCMYRCDDRDRWRRDRYDRHRYDRRYDRCRYDRCRDDRIYHDGRCWHHDGDRWRRCRSRDRDHY